MSLALKLFFHRKKNFPGKRIALNLSAFFDRKNFYRDSAFNIEIPERFKKE